MESKNINPQNVLTAFRHLLDRLPALIGESGWQQVGDTIQDKIEALAQSEDVNQQWLLTTELMEAVSPYPAARERLQTELYLMAELRDKVQPQLAQFARQLGVDDAQTELALNIALQAISVEVDPDEDVTRGLTRHIEINKGGVGGGKQVRLSNITLNSREWMQTGIEFTFMVGTGSVALFSLALLWIVLKLKGMAEVEISEQDATVFWGLLHACGRPNHPAKEHEVVDYINKERTKFGLGKLSEAAIKTSLSSLTRLGMVEAVADRFPMWQFVETCRIEM